LGLPTGKELSGVSPAIQACLKSGRPDALIRVQTLVATREQVTATPTLRLVDRQTGNTFMLCGAVDGDALLFAIDLLASLLQAGNRGRPSN